MIKVFSTLILLSVLFFSASAQTLATGKVTGRVLDNKNNPIIDAQVAAIDPKSKQTMIISASDYNGSYSLLVPEGTYDITVTSDIGNGKQTKTFANQIIGSSTVLDLNIDTKTKGLMFANQEISSYVFIFGLGVLLLIGVAVWVIKTKKQ